MRVLVRSVKFASNRTATSLRAGTSFFLVCNQDMEGRAAPYTMVFFRRLEITEFGSSEGLESLALSPSRLVATVPNAKRSEHCRPLIGEPFWKLKSGLHSNSSASPIGWLALSS